MADFPFTDDILATYDLLRTGTAYNTECLTNTANVRTTMLGLADLFDTLGIPELADHAATLRDYASPNGAFGQLQDHLTDQFDNLPVNLSIMQSYISDLSAGGRLPGYNDTSNSASSGGYVMVKGVSPRAMMLGAPSVFMMADTGSGSSGGAGGALGGAGGSQCASMGNAFGSIMGKANQFMGQAMGMLGGLSGSIGNLMGGNILGGIQGLMGAAGGSIPGLSNIPGIGNIGSLVSSISGLAQGNIGSLGQMGSLISAIGGANIPGLSQITGLLGGAGGMQQIGSLIQGLAGQATSSQGLGTLPNIATTNAQLTVAQMNVLNYDVTGLIEDLTLATAGMGSLTGLAGLGNVSSLTAQVQNLATFLGQQGTISSVGDITSLVTDLRGVATTLPTLPTTQTTGAGIDVPTMVSNLNALAGRLAAINNTAGTLTQMGALQSSLNDFGGLTGYGNLSNLGSQVGKVTSAIQGLASGNILQGLQPLLGSLGGLQQGIGQLDSLASAIPGLGGGLGQITGMLGGLASGNIGSIMGQLGNIGGLGSMLGNISGMMGGLGNIAGGIGSMIGGEKGILGAATGALKIIAGSFNLKALAGAGGCGAGVLGNVGSDALQSALGTGGGSGGSGGGSAAPDTSGANTPITATGLTPGAANPTPSLPTFAGSLNGFSTAGVDPNVVPTLNPGAVGGMGIGANAPVAQMPNTITTIEPIQNPPLPPSRARLQD